MNRRGFTWIEVLLVLAILAVIASKIVPLLFPMEWREFDDAIWTRLGIEPATGRVVPGVLFLTFLLFGAWRNRRERRWRRHMDKHPFVTLPLKRRR